MKTFFLNGCLMLAGAAVLMGEPWLDEVASQGSQLSAAPSPQLTAARFRGYGVRRWYRHSDYPSTNVYRRGSSQNSLPPQLRDMPYLIGG